MAKKKRTAKKAKKAKSLEMQRSIGYWIFLVGVLIAILAGLATSGGVNPNALWVLAVLGLIVGFLNITLKDEVPFLIASLVLISASGYLSFIPYIGTPLVTILSYIVVFVSPAAIIVALKAVYHFGRM